jgi:hypothetical protein
MAGNMYGCEILFTQEQGDKMMAMVERVTGKPCPCKSGDRCPILPITQAKESAA